MATEKKASAEHWSAQERKYYKENQNAIDRSVIFKLAKRLSELTDIPYTSLGYMVSDELLIAVRESLNGGKLYYPHTRFNNSNERTNTYGRQSKRSKYSESSKTDEEQCKS